MNSGGEPRVVAVIVAFWQERFGNVKQIVRDLQASTRPPDNILVLNNNPEYHLDVEGAQVINSEFNSRCRGKMLVALMDVADYYLILDDDTSVNPATIEKYLEVAHEDCAYAYCGIEFGGGNGNRIMPADVAEITEAEYFLGCGLFVSFKAIVNMLIADQKIRINTKWKHEGEDVLIGLVNKAEIVPMSEEDGFEDLDWGTEAMAFGSDGLTEGSMDYLIMRDKFMEDSKEILEI